jgi:LysM repeat protein
MVRGFLVGLAVLCVLAVPASATGQQRYVVRYGDTLTGIALAHGTSLSQLARMNNRPPYAVLFAGTILSVPSPGQRPRSTVSWRGAYTVRSGDTLSGIAERFGVGLRELAAANHLRVNGVLFAGSRLAVPSGHSGESRFFGRYRVVAGDTLSGIAARYGVGLRRLARANHLRANGILFAGITLRVPRMSDGRMSLPVPTGPWSVTTAIDYWCVHYGVNARLARAVAWQESGFQIDIFSSAGAWGPMQVMPGTWRYVERRLIGRRVARTGNGDIRIGVALLHHLIHAFAGNERLAVAAYYQGERSVRHYGLLPETRRYVANVLALRGRV